MNENKNKNKNKSKKIKVKSLLRYSVQASAVHGCMCVREWLCCVSAPCPAIRQHPLTAFSEQNTVQLHQTAGDRQDQQGAAVIKEFMSDCTT